MDFVVQTDEEDKKAHFEDIHNASITTKLISNNNQSGGQIEFHDPWYVSDENDTQPDTFLPFDAPYAATGKYNETGKGVFVDQHPDDDPVYYQVRAKVEQSINVHNTENIPYYFQNWSYNPATAEITNPDNTEIDAETGINYFQSPVVFKEDNAEMAAVYKGHLASSHENPSGFNNSRKLTKTDDGDLHLVYEDNKEIYYTVSTDGISWSKEIKISAGSTNVNPCIASFGNSVYIAWLDAETAISHQVTYCQHTVSGWSQPIQVATVMAPEAGPVTETTPVITVLNAGGNPKPIIVYTELADVHNAGTNQLKCVVKNTGWEQISVGAFGQHPALCADFGSEVNKTVAGLAYDYDGSVYYKEITSTDLVWSAAQKVSGSETWKQDQQNPSLTLCNSTAHIVWEGYNNAENRNELYYRELTNGNTTDTATPNPIYPGSGGGNPIIVTGPTTANAIAPSIGATADGDVAFFYTKDGDIYKKKRVGSTWKLYDYNRTGQYPSILTDNLKRATYTKYQNAPYLLKPLYTEPSSEWIYPPYKIIGKSIWNGNQTESTVRFDFPIDSVQNGIRPGYITLDILNVSFVEDSLSLNHYLQSDTLSLASALQPLEIDLRVRFINVDNGLDPNAVLFKADFMEDGQSTFLTDLRYHDLPAAAGDSVERFFKLATIVNLAGHVGHLQLKAGDVLPDMYIIQNEDLTPLAKQDVEGFSKWIPSAYKLSQNFPNPFNPSTHITFELPKSERIILDVYNIKGERVATLAEGTLKEGRYEVVFNGSGLASGVYFYRLKAGNSILTKRMLLIK